MILIKSSNPFLLARFGTELSMLGLENYISYSYPFHNERDINRIRIYGKKSWQYLSNDGTGENDHILSLDNDNYNQRIAQVESLLKK